MPSKIPAPTKKILDSLVQHGYIWDFENSDVQRVHAGKSIIRLIDVNGTYKNYQTRFFMRRWSQGQYYNISVLYNNKNILYLRGNYNLNNIFDIYVSFAEFLNKIKKEITDVKYFRDTGIKFTALSFSDNTYSVFVQKKRNENYINNYEAIQDFQSDSLRNLINTVKLVYRLS